LPLNGSSLLFRCVLLGFEMLLLTKFFAFLRQSGLFSCLLLSLPALRRQTALPLRTTATAGHWHAPGMRHDTYRMTIYRRQRSKKGLRKPVNIIVAIWLHRYCLQLLRSRSLHESVPAHGQHGRT
jgi:hypothetical protein